MGVQSKSARTKGKGKISTIRLREITHAPLANRKEGEPRGLSGGSYFIEGG